MVIDYRRLNKQAVKNNYLLPLITDLVDSIGNKRVFTKMDLQWEYNNVRIKKGHDELVEEVLKCLEGIESKLSGSSDGSGEN